VVCTPLKASYLYSFTYDCCFQYLILVWFDTLHMYNLINIYFKHKIHFRFWVFMAVKMVIAFWAEMPCGLVGVSKQQDCWEILLNNMEYTRPLLPQRRRKICEIVGF
jgi:hypothetical protein